MKTKRLARLLHDSDAQKWIDYEITGYPPVFDPAELGTCRKYYTGDRPVLRDERTSKPHPIGMPQLESYINGNPTGQSSRNSGRRRTRRSRS